MRPDLGRLLRPPAESALPLALLRVAVAALVLASPESDLAAIVAARPPAMWARPLGLGWLGALVPLTPSSIAVATRLLQAAAVLALLGVWTRPALAALAVGLLYVFGAAQLTGAVTHDMHLIWFAALLAVALGPGDDALGLGAWARGAVRGGPPSLGAARALLLARLWLGLVYFFPGVHKLARGAAWLSGDDLRGQLWFKWFEAGAAPWPRIDRAPGLLAAAAIIVVAFELAMPALVLARRTRPAAIALGLGFHLLAWRFLDVLFPSLVLCYVVLLPGRRGAPPSPSPSPSPPSPSSPPPSAPRARALGALAAGVTAPLVVLGAAGETQAYPFACYPTFASAVPETMPDLAVDVVAGGAARTYRLPTLRRQDEWATVWRLAGSYGGGVDPAALDAFARQLVPAEARAGARLRFVLEEYALEPERRGDPPIRRTVLHEADEASASRP